MHRVALEIEEEIIRVDGRQSVEAQAESGLQDLVDACPVSAVCRCNRACWTSRARVSTPIPGMCCLSRVQSEADVKTPACPRRSRCRRVTSANPAEMIDLVPARLTNFRPTARAAISQGSGTRSSGRSAAKTSSLRAARRT
jgi:hypothetical protein